MSWPQLAKAIFCGWGAGIVGWVIGASLISEIFRHLVCDVLHSGSYGCGEYSPAVAPPPVVLSTILWTMLIAVVVGSVQLLLAWPGRYFVRLRGLIFDVLIGICCGMLLVMFFTYTAESWRLEHWGRALEAWCREHDMLMICYALSVPYVLFWVAYWTLLPALLAAGLMRVGRAVVSRFARRDTSSGAS